MLIPDVFDDGEVLDSELGDVYQFGRSLFNTFFEIVDAIVLTNYMEYRYHQGQNLVVGFFKLPTILVPFKKFIINRSASKTEKSSLFKDDVTICLDFCNRVNHHLFNKQTFLNYHFIESNPKGYFDRLLSYMNDDYRACIPHYIDFFSSIDKQYIINQCFIANSRNANIFSITFTNGLFFKYSFNSPFPFGQFSYHYKDKQYITRKPTSLESASEIFFMHYLNLNEDSYEHFFKKEDNSLAYFFNNEQIITDLAEQLAC